MDRFVIHESWPCSGAMVREYNKQSFQAPVVSDPWPNSPCFDGRTHSLISKGNRCFLPVCIPCIEMARVSALCGQHL
jgi:hypothetical protein